MSVCVEKHLIQKEGMRRRGGEKRRKERERGGKGGRKIRREEEGRRKKGRREKGVFVLYFQQNKNGSHHPLPFTLLFEAQSLRKCFNIDLGSSIHRQTHTRTMADAL